MESLGSVSDPIFVSAKVAAERLGLKTWDIYELVKKGELAHLPRNSPGEQIRILASDIPRWAQEKAARATEQESA